MDNKFLEDARKFAEQNTREQLVELYLAEMETAVECEEKLQDLKKYTKTSNEQIERLKYKLGLIVRDNQELNRKIAELKEELGDWKVDGNMTILEKQLEIKKLQTQLHELPKKICDEIRKTAKCVDDYGFDDMTLMNREYCIQEYELDEIQKKYEVGDENNKK